VFVVTVLCKRLKTSNISFLTALFTASLEVSISHYLAQTTNNGTLGSFSSRIPTSLVLLHTTYTCAFKPGCLMSHNWLHTPDCKVLNEFTFPVFREPTDNNWETSRIATINGRACRAKFCAGVRRDVKTGAGVANPCERLSRSTSRCCVGPILCPNRGFLFRLCTTLLKLRSYDLRPNYKVEIIRSTAQVVAGSTFRSCPI